MSQAMTHFLGGRAAVLHPAPPVCEQLHRRLAALGIAAETRWPELGEGAFDLVLIDLDTAHDRQLPWPEGAAPMPMVGLVGSESPSRLNWALAHQIDAFLPQTALANLYSALVVASARHAERRRIAQDAAEAARRNSLRLEVIQAVQTIMQQDRVDAARALKKLRALAMVERCALEDAALMLLGRGNERRSGAGAQR